MYSYYHHLAYLYKTKDETNSSRVGTGHFPPDYASNSVLQ
jgi:hypothetical protein